MKSFLRNNYIEVYSAQNKGQSAIAKRFIRTLKKTNFATTLLQCQKTFVFIN